MVVSGLDTGSDVLDRAPNPEPADPRLFNPRPDLAPVKACSGLRPGFKYLKPKAGARMWVFFSPTSDLKWALLT
jgi:hypothetical protein